MRARGPSRGRGAHGAPSLGAVHPAAPAGPTAPGPLGAAARALAVTSLDAPLVAVPWAALLARAGGVTVDGLHLALLAAGVWLGYAADRWLDGRRLGPRAATARHRFARRHARGWLAAWSAVFAVALWLSLARLEPALLARGLGLAALVALYTLATHRHPAVARRVVPREVAVGLLVAGAVALFAWPDGRWTPGRALLIGCFALVCQLDTATVALLERELDAEAGEHSLARVWPGLSTALDAAGGCLALAAALVAILSAGGPGAVAWLALALAGVALVAVRRLPAAAASGSGAVDAALALPALVAWPLLG